MLAAEKPAWLPLGSLLVRQGLLTHEQLEEALMMQQGIGSGRRLGELLVEWGWVTTRSICEALAEQYELEFVDLATETVDRNVAHTLDEASVRDISALPVRRLEDGRILVAVADPTDVGAAEELRVRLGAIRLAVADIADLERATDAAFKRD